jgi:hypothetical protein
MLALLHLGANCPRIVPELSTVKDRELASGVGNVVRRRDVVTLENAARLVPAYVLGYPLRDSSSHKVAHARPSQVVKDHPSIDHFRFRFRPWSPRRGVERLAIPVNGRL